MTLQTVELGEGTEGSVIWMHGLGASGDDFVPLVPQLPKHLRYIFPHAPERKVTINAGMVMPSWYDILSLDFSGIREAEEDIRQSARQIEALISKEVDRGIPASRIVVAGFSQGGAMALHVGLRYPVALAGIMSLSAYLPIHHTIGDEAHVANSETPLFCAHGTQDAVVPLQAGAMTQALLKELAPTRDTEWKTYPMGHEVCQAEVTDLSAWLSRVTQA